jgi:hypothetical protein
MHVAGSSSGITYAMKELAGATSDQAKAAREFRKTFQHGSGGIYDAVQELPGLVPLIRASLIQAIGELIGLTAEERGKLRRRAYTFKRSPGEVRVTVKLFDAPVETLLSATNLPEVRLQLMPNSEPAETSGGPTYHGNLRIGVTNHLGRWGDGSIDWVDHDDPELVQPDA